MSTRIIFLINSLTIGGAERQLVELVRHLDQTQFEISIITFYDGGELRPQVESLDHVTVYSLGKKGRYGWGRPLLRLYRFVKQIRPQIIHGYMGVANELALIMGRLYGAKVVMGIRASNIALDKYTFLSRLSFRTGIWASQRADLVIFNSDAGKGYHVKQGYNPKNAIVVHNGIDIMKFRPDDAQRQKVRQEWQINEHELLIGMVARIDPMKGHDVFLQAAHKMIAQHAHLRFVCVGDGSSQLKHTLRQLSEQLELQNHLIWAGQRTDIPAVHNALDLLVMASTFGEGFPNAVGEAMACGIPCIVTNVGDAAFIVDNPAMVVSINDPAELAQKCLDAIGSNLTHLKTQASDRIRHCFTGEHLAGRTSVHLLGLISQRTA